jgi:hypothetical protein
VTSSFGSFGKSQSNSRLDVFGESYLGRAAKRLYQAQRR